MRYLRIAGALHEISLSERPKKAEIAAEVLSEVLSEARECEQERLSLVGESGRDSLCTVVRLLTGEVLLPWEGLEMGMGPEAVAVALSGLTDLNLSEEREKLGPGEMGAVAEAALQKRWQHPLVSEPLDALFVYDSLRRISSIQGDGSEQRKIAILRGLFLQATPIEGRFIACTVMRRMRGGIGPSSMISALAALHGQDARMLRMTYSIMPDLGGIAAMAQKGSLDRVRITPGIPVLRMRPTRGSPELPALFLPVYPGLFVQIHKPGDGGRARIFSSGNRDLTQALQGLSEQIEGIKGSFVADACLMGFHDSGGAGSGAGKGPSQCSRNEMRRYMSRERNARRISIRTGLMLYDLLYCDDHDICKDSYMKRREQMLRIFGEPGGPPFSGITTAPELLLEEEEQVSELLSSMRAAGAVGLYARGQLSPYRPGMAAGDGLFAIK